MKKFAIALVGQLCGGESTYYYGDAGEVEQIVNPYWILAKDDWRKVVTVEYYMSEDQMNKELEYKKKCWTDSSKVEFVVVGNKVSLGSESVV